MKSEVYLIAPSRPLQPGTFDLSTWDQTFPCLYTPRFHLFPLASAAELAPVVNTLRSSLAKALAEWPDLCGTVIDQDKQRGTCSLHLSDDPTVELRFQDLRSSGEGSPSRESEATSFEQLARAGFPPVALAQASLANFDRKIEERPCPVFKAQVNAIDDGLVLAMGFLHRVVDGESIRGLLHSWARHTRQLSEGHPVETRALGLSDRSLMSKGLPGGQITDFPELKMVDSFSWGQAGDTSKVVCPIWRIGKTEQDRLKATSSARSTNDAVCVCLWLAVSKARQLFTSSFESSNLSIGMNVRPRLDPPLDDFAGNATYRVGLTVSIQELSVMDLVTAARRFRQALDEFSSAKFMKLLGFVDKLSSIDALQPSYRLHAGPDLFLTTHAHFREYENNWGPLLGIPSAVRVLPVPVEGFCVVFSRHADGALEVMTSLREDVFERLHADKEFASYFSLVCE